MAQLPSRKVSGDSLTAAEVNGILDHTAGSINAATHGATGDGSTDDRDAIQAALTAAGAAGAGGVVILPPGTFLLGSAISIPAQVVVRGAGQVRTTLKRGFTGDLVTSQASYSVLQDLTIDGDTANRGSGRGVLIPASSFGQEHRNIAIKNFSQACLEFGADGGSEFKSFGSTYYTTGATGKVAAVKGGATTQAIPRHFFGTASLGCTLFDFGQADHWWASGFYTNGLIFSSDAAFNIELRHMRVGTIYVTTGDITAGATSLSVETGDGALFAAGDGVTVWGAGAGGNPLVAKVSSVSTDTLTLDVAATVSVTGANVSRADVVKGDSHFMSGVSAQGMVIESTGSILDVQTSSWALRDLGTNNSITQVNPSYWAMSWTGTGGNPSLGNGTLVYRWSRRGAWIKLQADLTYGSTSSAGTGTWEFSLPQPSVNVGSAQICGTAYMINGASSSAYVGAVRVAAGASVVRIYYGSGATLGAAGATTPFTWDTGATLRFECEYRVP